MERRLYFVVGDALACASTGAVTGAACATIFGPAWPMFPAMIVAMLLGMIISLPLIFGLFLWMFGAMEVMVPSMLTGMVAGMAVGMAATRSPVSELEAAGTGALIGLGVLVVTYALNARISGKSQWTT